MQVEIRMKATAELGKGHAGGSWLSDAIWMIFKHWIQSAAAESCKGSVVVNIP